MREQQRWRGKEENSQVVVWEQPQQVQSTTQKMLRYLTQERGKVNYHKGKGLSELIMSLGLNVGFIVECRRGSLGPGWPGDSEKVPKNKRTSAHPGQG